LTLGDIFNDRRLGKRLQVAPNGRLTDVRMDYKLLNRQFGLAAQQT